jgi:putative membrane protein
MEFFETKRASTASRIASLGLTCALVWSAGIAAAIAQTAAPPEAPATLNAVPHGAYDAMIFTLEADRHAAFDRIYVNGQVEYQKGNAALFEQEIQNGTDPNLKESARQTLPKIVDHLHRAEKLAAELNGRLASK